jgi:hypothetical protein
VVCTSPVASKRTPIGKNWCLNCGQALDVPADKKPHVVLAATSGKPTERVVYLDEAEIHRCKLI